MSVHLTAELFAQTFVENATLDDFVYFYFPLHLLSYYIIPDI